jgi:hypothetical protein
MITEEVQWWWSSGVMEWWNVGWDGGVMDYAEE